MADTHTDTPVRTDPFPGLPDRYGGNELAYLKEALESQNLFYTRDGGYTGRMLEMAKERFGAKYAVPCSSGTAAIHVGIAAARIEPGAEVITSPITDAGTIVGIIQQNAIPVFCDLDPHHYNMTAQAIEAVITDRTQAVLLVHLAGVAADMDDIVDLCRRKNLKLIEDCAQSYGCYYKDKHVGTFGDVGCYSLNTYKHLSCGDGGIVVTDDEDTYKFAHNWADKFYDRLGQGNRMHASGGNYRMTELQGAVALAQFERFDSFVDIRRERGDALNAALDEIPGVHAHGVSSEKKASYWFYMFRVDEDVIGMTRDEFVTGLQNNGIPASGGYVPTPMYRSKMFLDKNFFAGGIWPAEIVAGKTYDYSAINLPVAEEILRTAVRVGVHQGWTQREVDDTVAAIRKVVGA